MTVIWSPQRNFLIKPMKMCFSSCYFFSPNVIVCSWKQNTPHEVGSDTLKERIGISVSEIVLIIAELERYFQIPFFFSNANDGS